MHIIKTKRELFKTTIYFLLMLVVTSNVQSQSLEGLYLCACGENQEKPFASPLRDCTKVFGSSGQFYTWRHHSYFRPSAPFIGGSYKPGETSYYGLSIFNVPEAAFCPNPQRVKTEAELKIDILLKQVQILEQKISALEAN